jgi:hypothetical protein
VLKKVARKILALAPTRNNIPIPIPIPLASSSSANFTLTSERLSSSPSRPQSPSLLFNNYHPTSTFPVPLASPSPPALATPTSSNQRRRGAIIELPNEWYAKAEQYNTPAFARNQTKERVEAEPIRRVKSYQPPPPPPTQSIRSIGLSVLGGVKRGRSAQAALGVSPSPAPNTARAEEHERHQDVFDWRDSLGLSDEVAMSFDLEEELDQVLEAIAQLRSTQ